MPPIEDLPPPRTGAAAGFYPDPLGSNRGRWWDGTGWTLRIGPRVPPGTAMGKQLDPPEKTCPRCGMTSQTFASHCPSCGRDFRLNRGMIVGMVAAAIGVTLLLGGCVALINLADSGDDEISREDFDSVSFGDSMSSVEEEFGDPWEREEFREQGATVKCIEYFDEGDLDRTYDFCFVNGRLVNKLQHD